MSDLRAELYEQFIKDHYAWLKSVAASLIAEGFAATDITVEYRPDNTTRVLAKSMPRFERKVHYTCGGEPIEGSLFPPFK